VWDGIEPERCRSDPDRRASGPTRFIMTLVPHLIAGRGRRGPRARPIHQTPPRLCTRWPRNASAFRVFSAECAPRRCYRRGALEGEQTRQEIEKRRSLSHGLLSSPSSECWAKPVWVAARSASMLRRYPVLCARCQKNVAGRRPGRSSCRCVPPQLPRPWPVGPQRLGAPRGPAGERTPPTGGVAAAAERVGRTKKIRRNNRRSQRQAHNITVGRDARPLSRMTLRNGSTENGAGFSPRLPFHPPPPEYPA